ncbi:hypothetical protein [Streptacidiphilus sp. MAP5-52]|uniref:hypothetical protein n=1 Tax=Streptacidiphilus sp. MAP5-52 TaxID=3156267 RepID=UPI0035122CE3
MATAVQQPQTSPDTTRRVPGAEIHRRVKIERASYLAAATAVAVAPQMYAGPWAELGGIAAVTGTGLWLYTRAESVLKQEGEPDHVGLLRTAQRALPLLGFAGSYLADVLHPGMSWWELLAPAAWGALMGWWAPLTRSAGLVPEALPLPAAPVAAPGQQAGPPRDYPGFLDWLWQRAELAPGTRLTKVRQYQAGAPDFEAVIVAQAGRAVPSLTARSLAACFDVPEGTAVVMPIDGSGPGRMRLRVTPTVQAATRPRTAVELWDANVACPGGAAPGMHIIDHRVEEGRIVLLVRAQEGSLIRLPQVEIARALGVQDTDLLMIETDGLGDGVVSIYEKHPLLDIREATAEDLVMDEDGRIQLGLRHDGRPARVPLYDPTLGAITDLFVGAPGAGKSVALNTILAAERINGIVSIVADAQNGMSLPEANGRVYHFGSGIAAVGATLAAAYMVAVYREQVSSANGWGGFERDAPWPLANISLDELNLILSDDSDVPDVFKTWIVGLVAKFQSTGRKMGLGLRFAAQSIHLADLGNKAKIRSNAKNGTVWLGRTNSSTTQQMATDGVVPAGITIAPIPRYFRNGANRIRAAWLGKEVKTGPTTAGMSWTIQGGEVFLSRVFKAVKVNRTFPGLIELYESAPIPRLTPEEDAIFQQAYAEALPLAEALLLGDDGSGADEFGDDGDGGGGGGRGRRKGKSKPRFGGARRSGAGAAVPPPPPQALPERILGVLALADNQKMKIRDIRAALPDANPTSVGNAMTALRGQGLVAPVSNGVWQLTVDLEDDNTDGDDD